MKLVLAAALLALSFTTGFTCSKNTPAEAPTETTMAAPAETTETTMPSAEAMPTEESTTTTMPQ